MNKLFLICTLLISSAYLSEAILDGGIIAGAAIAGVIGLKIAGGIGFGVGLAASRRGGRGGGGGHGRFGRSVNSVEDAFLAASVDDADDCAKKMVCMVYAKDQESLTDVEQALVEMFGQSEVIDVSKSSVEFDLAALVGRKVGSLQCKSVYARCPHHEDFLVGIFGA